MPRKPKNASRSLHRRIEALERAEILWRDHVQQIRQQITHTALSHLLPPVVEQFLAALGAEREGRALNPEESAAKQAYQEALTQECRRAGYRSTEAFKDALQIDDVVTAALSQGCIASSDMMLTQTAGEAQQQGQDPTPEEFAALQRFSAEWTRLWRLAGYEPAGAEFTEEGS